METSRNTSSGAITVEGKDFSVLVEAEGVVTVTYPERVVHVKKEGRGDTRNDARPPRSRPADRKRGSR
jgi:hypothetical protein